MITYATGTSTEAMVESLAKNEETSALLVCACVWPTYVVQAAFSGPIAVLSFLLLVRVWSSAGPSRLRRPSEGL
jgi:hypothetical protein